MIKRIAVAAAALAAAGTISGVALARTTATKLGTGVVLINTALGYQDGAAAGTGMVLTSSGEILTNNQVVRGATSIKVVIPGTRRSYTANVVGYDVADDVAVIKAVGASNLKTISTSTMVAVGDAVTALGNANGGGTLVSAKGSVTGLNRSITVNDDQGGAQRLTGLIETDADVVPGDSGGPLYDSAGRVVGMDSAGSAAFFRSGGGGEAYAIPIAKALSIVKQIDAGTSSARVHVGPTPFLGVQVQTRFGRFSSGGAVIAAVTPGGPADTAGLEPGSVITAIDGHAITTPTAIASSILAKKPGGTVTVTYTDAYGGSQSVSVTLGSGPAQ